MKIKNTDGLESFCMLMEDNEQKYFQKGNRYTGVELTPGEPTVCLGNGEQGLECCCDECDYYLLCYPEFDPKNKEKIWLIIKLIFDDYIKKDEEF